MPAPYNKKRKTILLIGDYAVITLSFYFSLFVRFGSVLPADRLVYAFFFSSFVYVTSFYIFDLYNFTYRVRSAAYLARYLFSICFGTAFVAIFYYVFPFMKIGRGLLFIHVFFISFIVYLWHLTFFSISDQAKKDKNIVIIGAGSSGQMINEILTKANVDFNVVGFLDDRLELQHQRIGTRTVLGTSASLVSMAANNEIDAAVIAVTYEKSPDLLKAIIDAKMKGIDVSDMPTLFEELTGKLPVEHMGAAWIARTTFKGVRRTLYTLHIKRVIDVVLSLFGLVLTLPLMALVAIVIRMESRGPVVYRQKRVGYKEEVFELLKFRSMLNDAESQGAVWAKKNDPRVTRIGKFLRKSRMDEIPQMWNVLRGEMSFFGPRPERPEFVDNLKKDIPFYSLRHSIKPGITGWAQVNYQYGASKEDALEKLQYDLFYLKNHSALLDFQILLRTFRVVLFGQGAR